MAFSLPKLPSMSTIFNPRHHSTAVPAIFCRPCSSQHGYMSAETDMPPRNYHIVDQCETLDALKQVHANKIITGEIADKIVATKMIVMYGVFDSMECAHRVFNTAFERNVYLWNALIRGYSRNGPYEKAIQTYHQMRGALIDPDKFTFPLVLRACTELQLLEEGKKMHHDARVCGFGFDIFVGNALVSMYSKCGRIDLACQVFDEMPERDLISWNALIDGSAQSGHNHKALEVFQKMYYEIPELSRVSVMSALQACANLGRLDFGRIIHTLVMERPWLYTENVENSLISMYAKCGEMELAKGLFDKMEKRNIVSWNAMMAGYAQNGYGIQAIDLFKEMQCAGLKPSFVTMVSLSQAFAQVLDLKHGKCIHAYALRKGFESDVVLMTAVVELYSQCGLMSLAELVFCNMDKKNGISYNAIMAGYSKDGEFAMALKTFCNMLMIPGIRPDTVTMITILPACASSGAIAQGMSLHGYIIKSGLEGSNRVPASLMDMYAKCQNMETAWLLFKNMDVKNLVSWNTIINAFVQNEELGEGIRLFNQMQLEGFEPDTLSVLSITSGCADSACLQQGKMIHAYVIKKALDSYLVVGNSIIDMYMKCGSVDDSRLFFDKMAFRDAISWNTMMSGYGMHGNGQDVFLLFSEMESSSFRPDSVAFLSVLSACSHAGLVEEGWRYFNIMIKDYGVNPRPPHYACMVDLLGRAGCLEEAFDFIQRMPCEPSSSVWGALLGACRIHHNMKLGEYAAEKLFELEPENSGYHVLLSNIYAAHGRWKDVSKVRNLMKQKAIRKKPGCTLIEVDNKIHSFVVGDSSHPEIKEIYETLESLGKEMMKAGYVPDTDFVLQDVEDEVKEHMLSSHSERLAIAYGIMKSIPGTPIRITKNLRVCGDCHNATKFISKIAGREIVVRDAHRFHHFKDGSCSCGDYW